MLIQDINICSLKSDNVYKDLRFLSEEKKDVLIDVIKKYNLYPLPVVDTEGNVLSGHDIIEIFKNLGEAQIKVIICEKELTEKEKYKLGIDLTSINYTVNYYSILSNWALYSKQHGFDLSEKVGGWSVMYLNNLVEFDWPKEDTFAISQLEQAVLF